jgi:hypothetical protein
VQRAAASVTVRLFMVVSVAAISLAVGLAPPDF